MSLDLEIKQIAEDWAEKIYVRICQAASDPAISLEGEELEFYTELKEWGWFDLCPIEDDDREMLTRSHLAIRKYGKLKWAKKHPPKKKLSKWEVVMGKAGGPKR
jgi:hypothetical protein|tara:strand:+ start:4655 stop:4966 length:312 start_codon:yes stop_codon:yes gene_type:complete